MCFYDEYFYIYGKCAFKMNAFICGECAFNDECFYVYGECALHEQVGRPSKSAVLILSLNVDVSLVSSRI